MDSSLPKRIKELRMDLKMTQEELSEALSHVTSTISSYEKGASKPTHETLLGLAFFFDVSLDYLVGNVDIKIATSKYSENDDIAKLVEVLNKFTDDQKRRVLGMINFLKEDYKSRISIDKEDRVKEINELSVKTNLKVEQLLNDKMLSKRMKSVRTENKYKQIDVARLLEAKATTISSYETGQNIPYYTHLSKISKQFNVSLDYLAGLTDNKKLFSEIIEDRSVQKILDSIYTLSKEDQEDIIENIYYTQWKNEKLEIESQKVQNKVQNKDKVYDNGISNNGISNNGIINYEISDNEISDNEFINLFI